MMKILKIIVAWVMCLSVIMIQSHPLYAKTYSKVTYINVGHGDSALIQANGKTTVIDTGYGKGFNHAAYHYLKKKKIHVINNLILTHAHPDHIGDVATLIRHLSVRHIYMSSMPDKTRLYQKMLATVRVYQVPCTHPKKGQVIHMGHARLKFLSNGRGAHNVNDSSLVMIFNDTRHRFYFGGDSSKRVEKKLRKKAIRCDVLKLSHHGSSSATSSRLLKYSHARYAVLSCGRKERKYPSPITLGKLMYYKVKLFRTDMQGTIVCTSGKKLKFSVRPIKPRLIQKKSTKTSSPYRR